MLDTSRDLDDGLVITVESLDGAKPAPVVPRDLLEKDERYWARRRRQAAIVAGLAVALALAAYLVAVLIGTQVVYVTARARAGNLAVVVRSSGTLVATTYAVNSTVTGTLTSLAVEVGNPVKSGQTLAQVDSPALDDALTQAHAAVASAQTTVADAQALQSATQDDATATNTAAWHQEQSDLYGCQHPTATTPPNCHDAAIARYNAALAHTARQVAAAQATADAAQKELTLANAAEQTAQDNVNAGTIVAPHDGTVASIAGNAGEQVGPGAVAGGGPLITIADLAALQVRTQVSQSDSARVQRGQAVSFTLAAYPKRVFRGAVSGIAPVPGASAAGGYPVTVDVDMLSLAGSDAATGAPAAVTIYLAQRYSTLLVPAAAVAYAHRVLAGVERTTRKGAVTAGDLPSAAALQQAHDTADRLLNAALANGVASAADAPKADVLVAGGKQGWILKPVVLGLTDGTSVAVLAGLKPGDAVTSGQHTLAPAPATHASGAAAAGDPPRIFGS
jgi:HlyD family secretion protein